MAGTLLGALFLGVIVNALPVMQITPFWQMAISGAVILAAVVANARAEKRGVKLILPEARRAAGTAKGARLIASRLPMPRREDLVTGCCAGRVFLLDC